MQTRPFPFWLMIVSIAIAVLPVCRSPMIELALAAADRDQGVDGLDARLDRRVDRLADDDSGGDALDGARRRGGDRPFVVDRIAEWVDDATQQSGPDRDLDDAAGRLDRVAFLDGFGLAEDDRTDGLLLEVERHAHHAVGEFEHLGRQRAVESVDLSDAVTDLDHGPDAARLDAGVERVDGGLDDAGDLVGTDGHMRIS